MDSEYSCICGGWGNQSFNNFDDVMAGEMMMPRTQSCGYKMATVKIKCISLNSTFPVSKSSSIIV